MTDTTTPTPRATVCEVEGCHTLIPATLEDRREHRRGHAHDRKVIEALREALKDANVTIRRLAGRLDDLEREVGQIEIPEPVDPFAIVPANDLDPLEDEDDDDQVSQYLDDDYQPDTSTRADAIAAFTSSTEQDDPDDGYYNPVTRP